MNSRAATSDAAWTAGELRVPLDVRTMSVAALAAAVAVAIQSLWIPLDPDVSWLITVCERMLSGDRLYVDIVEVNPPASVWLYLPLVWLAKLVGARPEAVVAAGFTAGALGSVLATSRIASGLKDPPRPLWFAAAVSFIALVLPMALFAQREHAALLLALPALATLARVADGSTLGKRAVAASGFAAGLVLVIKPYFLPAVLAPALWAAWKRRSIAPLGPGIAGAAAAIGAYAIGVVAFASAYFDWLPVIAHTYAPMHMTAWKVFLGPLLFPGICLALGALVRPHRIPQLAIVWGLGSLGFVVAAMAQAKNYPNHWLPGTGLALAAGFTMLLAPGSVTARRKLVAAALAFVAFCETYTWAIIPDPLLAAAVQRVAPPAPKIIALSPQLVTGHSVTRNVGGQWVGSRAGLFTAAGARYLGLKDELAQSAYREDILSFARDVQRSSPDVVLVDTPSKAWLMREPAIARTMQAYRPAAKAGNVEVWVRRTPAP
jgi:hypothetical protein